VLTIVMYHYVRDLARSRFPRVKGLDLARFRGQVDYLLRHHTVVTMGQAIAAAHGGDPLPDDAALLTFDDGYADHYQSVFPVLDDHGIQGSFFPPSAAVLDGRVLDVNKIHYVLASVDDAGPLVGTVLAMMDGFRADHPLEPAEAYLARYAQPNRFDPAEVIFVKRMLQVGLPEPVRHAIADELFRRHVTADERAFAAELYVTPAQLRCMRRHGMFIGSHTHDHCWLDSVDAVEQQRQVDLSLDFLRTLGCDVAGGWVMCYPYGAYNDPLLAAIRGRGCRLGLTTHVGPADVAGDPLRLSRFDTNDLPTAA
jgi:peptidoglycan/xylan/chitin deacetylase (PgdA/CDA1 family)